MSRLQPEDSVNLRGCASGMPGPNCSATITTNALVRAAELTARDQSSPLPQNIKLPKIDLALLQVMVRTKNFPESVCRSITLVAVDAPAK